MTKHINIDTINATRSSKNILLTQMDWLGGIVRAYDKEGFHKRGKTQDKNKNTNTFAICVSTLDHRIFNMRFDGQIFYSVRAGG